MKPLRPAPLLNLSFGFRSIVSWHGGLAMGFTVFGLGLAFLVAVASRAQAPTPDEEALRILSLGWGAGQHGGIGMWGNVPNCAYTLECTKQTYCAFLALLCKDMTGDSGPLANGIFRTINRREIKWECRSLDGKTGQLTIDGRKYNLMKGRLFLIVPQKDRLAVHQINVDLTRLSKESIHRIVMAQSDEQPEVREALKSVGLIK
jgi:hypothetical protein